MIIERLSAVAFGPLVGEVVDFKPGMNVIFGPNEAAKSTLHAALYAGLCGMRRSRGSPRLEDREFDTQHRPWDVSSWKVQLRIQLADGRRIELDQDLANLGAACARDLGNGRDVTSEIINDGSPDGSAWLGLTRRSFLSTACIRQAQLMAVAAEPEALQEELQRAAATAGRDETAAAAIAQLQAFKSDRVGLDRANSTKPLRRTREAVALRTTELQGAEVEHTRVLLLLQQADEHEARARDAEADVKIAEAGIAEQLSRDALPRLERIRELKDRHPTEPAPVAQNLEQADRVAAVLSQWEAAPQQPDLTGASARDIRDQLASLPAVPTGDVDVHETVRTAANALAGARASVAFQGVAPSEPGSDDVAATDDELRRLADTLEVEAPALDPQLEEQLSLAIERSERANSRPRLLGLAIGALLGLAGLALLLVNLIVGAAALIAGVGVIAWTLASARGGAGKIAALEELRAAENALGEKRHEIDSVMQRRTEALARCAVLSIPPDALAIRARLDNRARASTAAEMLREWKSARDQLDAATATAERVLRVALTARGVQVVSSVDIALAEYEAQCKERASIAAKAARRGELEASLLARVALEAAANARTETIAGLLAVAAQVGGRSTTPDDAVHELQAWQVQRTVEAERHESGMAEWNELQTLLGDRTLSESEESVAALTTRARELTEGLDPNRVTEMASHTSLEAELRQLRSAARRAVATAAETRGEALAAAAAAPSVPEAEEAFAAAARELERVESLSKTLEVTLEYLERAQERVHRDIAPVLARTVVRWLPDVTAGRYSEATVDPETLEVRVRGGGGTWREAARLSHGTREQIYLLLRLALSEHLVTPGEITPLLFDEVTAHCDGTRREAVLAVLQELSVNRQVVVFTHEEPVREWARNHLVSERDAAFVRESVPLGGTGSSGQEPAS